MLTVKAARVAGVVARHRRAVVPLLRSAAVQMSGKADSSEYTAWAKNADSLPSWDGDVETMHEWCRIDYDDRGFTMDVRPNYNKENPWTADVAWEDVTRICFHVGGPPLVPHDVYFFVKRPRRALLGDTERGAHERPTARQKDHGEPASWDSNTPRAIHDKTGREEALHRRTV